MRENFRPPSDPDPSAPGEGLRSRCSRRSPPAPQTFIEQPVSTRKPSDRKRKRAEQSKGAEGIESTAEVAVPTTAMANVQKALPDWPLCSLE